MSIEALIQANTAALIALTEALNRTAGSAPAPANLAEAKPAEVKAATPPKDETPPVITVKDEAPTGTPLTYADIRVPFLALVAKNRDAAIKVLKDHGLDEKSGLKVAKPEQYASILAAVQKASA